MIATRCDRWGEKTRGRTSLIVSGWSRGADRAMPEKSWQLDVFCATWSWYEAIWSEWSWMMCMFDMCSFLLRMVHSLCSIIWAQMTWCISHILVASQNGSQDNAEVRSKISCEELRIMWASWRNALASLFGPRPWRSLPWRIGRIGVGWKFKSPVPMNWPIDHSVRASVLSISATSGPHQCSRQWSPTFLRIGVTKHYLSPAIFSLWLRQASSCWIHLHKCAHCWLPCNTTGCFVLVDADFVCLYCVSISWHIMTWSAHSAADRSKAHLTTPFINLKVNAALSRACRSCMMLHVFQHCSTFFNIVQLIAKSCGVWTQGHKRLMSSHSSHITWGLGPPSLVSPMPRPGESDHFLIQLIQLIQLQHLHEDQMKIRWRSEDQLELDIS